MRGGAGQRWRQRPHLLAPLPSVAISNSGYLPHYPFPQQLKKKKNPYHGSRTIHKAA